MTHTDALDTADVEDADIDGHAGLVSVVIPCFNAEAFLRSTLDSVCAQTYAHMEVIVVDDGSSDGSVAIAQARARVDARVRLIQMPKHCGAPAAPRNAGVMSARGAWVAFLDADDLWHPRKLEYQMETLASSGALMCSTQMRDFRDEREVVFAAPIVPLRLQRITWRQQLFKYRTPTSSIVARRELMQAHPFNEDPSYKAREDTDCFIRVHEYMPFSIKIAHPLVHYRQQASQISGHKGRMVARHLAMLRKYRQRSGAGLGAMAYVYTCTHFAASLYVRWFRRML